MTLAKLKYVVTIVDTKSMNKAAEILFVSQPALSLAIAELEEELGIQIFLRTSKGIKLTLDGEEFVRYARQMVELGSLVEERFVKRSVQSPKFSVSMQHYSFAVEAFIKLAKEFKMEEYELAVHETKTSEVIDNVKNYRSEIGVIYQNSFNKKAMDKILKNADLEFIKLFDCDISVYLGSNHPLASKKIIEQKDLEKYPFLSFEQGDKNSFYFAEEVLSTNDYKQVIKVDDRSTMLNMMTGLNGYTMCCGIICKELNGDIYKSVPLKTKEKMTIGYIKRKNMPLSLIGERYVEILKTYDV